MAFGLEENAKKAQQWVHEEVEQLLSKRSLSSEPKPILSSSSFSVAGESVWDHFNSKVCNNQTTAITSHSSARLEIAQYLDVPYLDRHCNPLDFWERHKAFVGYKIFKYTSNFCIIRKVIFKSRIGGKWKT